MFPVFAFFSVILLIVALQQATWGNRGPSMSLSTWSGFALVDMFPRLISSLRLAGPLGG